MLIDCQLSYLPDHHMWPTYVTYLPELFTWPTYLPTYLPTNLLTYKRHFLQLSCAILAMFLAQHSPWYFRSNIERHNSVHTCLAGHTSEPGGFVTSVSFMMGCYYLLSTSLSHLKALLLTKTAANSINPPFNYICPVFMNPDRFDKIFDHQGHIHHIDTPSSSLIESWLNRCLVKLITQPFIIWCSSKHAL